MKKITEEELKELEILLKSCSPIPWDWQPPTEKEENEGRYRYYVTRKVGCGDVPPEKFFITIIHSLGNPKRDMADAKLIAKAVTILPRMISQLRKALRKGK